MTENDQPKPAKPLGLSKQVDLKKPLESGKVRQTFSHGRSKTVTVEVKRKRVLTSDGPGHPGSRRSGGSGHLTNQEWDSRLKAVQSAIQAETDEGLRTELQNQERDKERERQELLTLQRQQQEAAAAAEIAEKEISLEMVAPVDRTAAAELDPERAKAALKHITAKPTTLNEDEAEADTRHSKGDPLRKTPVVRRDEKRKPSHKIAVNTVLDEDGEEKGRTRSLAAMRRAREKSRARMMMDDGQSLKTIREVIVPETICVGDLANRMAIRGGDVIKSLMKMGMMVTINQHIDADTAELIVGEYGHKIKRVSDSDIEIGIRGDEDQAAQLTSRAPVVTIMGHVDHGKTSLLDALRKTDVVSTEAGGITQHIGAYQVVLASGKRITFIDTPGHAAFTHMRARGANVTDIVVLVVAADDGMKEQTIEAIHHAKAAKVPIVIAINKMDKPDANADRVRMDLLQQELVVEKLGGDILDVEVSAKTGFNLDKLEEAILLQAEILDLKANANRLAEGVIIEARMEKGRGSVATVLVQKGTLNVGDIFIAGNEWGRVRVLNDDRGTKRDSAGPCAPVEVVGFNATPQAGDDFIVVNDENKARQVTSFRQQRHRELLAASRQRNTMEQMMTQIAAGERKELAVVIKSDVQGSLEAIIGSLEKIETNNEVHVRILHAAVGGINESDVTLANASNAIIIGFNVRANPQARDLARRDAVDIRYYSIIYNAIDDIKAAMSGLLSPIRQEHFLGYAEIRTVFNITKVGKVAGCMVTEGVVKRGAKVRLLRDNVVIHEGSLKTLKRMKDEVKEVKDNFECGMAFENYTDIQVGDRIECFEVEEIARTLA
jgi:translation initiation factor IF-2